MADKSFGVKEVNVIGATGDPTIQSPGLIKFNTGGANERLRIDASGYTYTNYVVGDGSDRNFATRYYITANGNSAYRFAGPGLVNTSDNPTLYLQRGMTYLFENSTGANHPFAIRYSDGGTGYGSTYLSGSNQGVQVFNVPFDAPASLVYQCTMHSGMLGTLTIVS